MIEEGLFPGKLVFVLGASNSLCNSNSSFFAKCKVFVFGFVVNFLDDGERNFSESASFSFTTVSHKLSHIINCYESR